MLVDIRSNIVITLAIASSLAASSAISQSYPSKPIRLIVPFAPGGPVDGFARLLGPQLNSAFKQSVIIDNRPGASGMIGIEAGVRANPDGYTITMVSSSYAASAAANQLSYDPVHDVAPIILLDTALQLAAVHPSVPVKTVPELIAYAKANPGKLNYGSSGTGGSVHLSTELFTQLAGIQMTHVPYKGQGPALNDLIGGQIHLLIGSGMVIYPHVKANRLRAIAVTSPKRSNAMPDIPAFAETVPGYENLSWQAILGPRALPKAIVMRWNAELNRLLQLPEIKDRLAAEGTDVAGGPPNVFFDVLKRYVSKWQTVVRKAGLKPAP
jgi:tripartite-type tricarboxylate transporter receptor subunit TctC